MKIHSKTKKILICSTCLAVIAGIAGIACAYNNRVWDVNAQDSSSLASPPDLIYNPEDNFTAAAAGDLAPQYDYLYEDETDPTDEHLIVTSNNLPSFYDARDRYNSVRNKNQHSEGTCWLYSAVTALEYYLAAKYENYEVSVKHLDYLITEGDVYEQDNVSNTYFSQYSKWSYHRIDMGTAGNNEGFVYGILNPLSIMSESDFTNVLKANDSRLASINRYEDIWSLDNANEILEPNVDDYPSYLKKQDFYKVNDPSKVKYMVTGAKLATSYALDESRTADSDAINKIKERVYNYGAVKVSVPVGNWEECNTDIKTTDDSRKQYTLVSPQQDGCSANHGMTIVGWDDEWKYQYNGETKRGAFVLQNSWGESAADKNKWHLGYISALVSMMFFDSVIRYNDYDHYYGPDNYQQQTITPAEDEIIFELSTTDDTQIESFTFGTLSADSYDVYISESGRAEGFVKDGSFDARRGITEYQFSKNYNANGNYAIKLKTSGSTTVSEKNRGQATITMMAEDHPYTQTVEPYLTDETSKYLDLTDFHHDIDSFAESFDDKYSTDIDSTTVDGAEALYTGGKTQVYKNGAFKDSYTNVVRGDTNGDGEIGILDYIKIKKDILNQEKLQNEYQLAGDMDKNGTIGTIDYIRIKKRLLNQQS